MHTVESYVNLIEFSFKMIKVTTDLISESQFAPESQKLNFFESWNFEILGAHNLRISDSNSPSGCQNFKTSK
ncbi:Protein CBG25847 [Caenorhabditis briggsae]|uniref:Protein CBG25847 n=1 Tax=Caenorhabditis briggsae TaxID=6238 RepID=B6IHB8_CAEBR|nr:Protein CBG25847 [Caenorhabditis briggsae]CAR99298.1 Protein CBG25847 [Caenorhabditis briggsae]